ncbi:MAG: chemotaxis protein CheW [Candidatus Omnitrophota bacterium]
MENNNEHLEKEKLILNEEDFYKERVPKEESVQLVVFRLSAEFYCVDINNAEAVMRIEDIAYLPEAPNHIAGITNLRGNILSVTNLKVIFGLEEQELTPQSRLVVIRKGQIETGVIVDEVLGVADVNNSQIEPALVTLPAEKAQYIEGQCSVDGKMIGILNVNKILEK